MERSSLFDGYSPKGSYTGRASRVFATASRLEVDSVRVLDVVGTPGEKADTELMTRAVVMAMQTVFVEVVMVMRS